MSKISFVFTKEMAGNLKKIREKAGLSQLEVAKRIGLTYKTADSFISHLEKGSIKNPSLGAILLYLRACGESWSEFFKELDAIDFKLRHEKMIAQLPIPPEKRKIERAAMRYETGIEFPSREKEELDFARLKQQIKNKVEKLVSKEQITLTPTLSYPASGKNVGITAYQKFAFEYFDFFTASNKAGMKLVINKYRRAGLQFHLLFKITKIIYSVIKAELKRIEAKRPLPTEKQERMAIRFTKYRIMIEHIEAEVHKLLCESGVPSPWFLSYKAFTRECVKALRKYYLKNPEMLKKALAQIVERWEKEGLKQDVLLKLKARIIRVFAKGL
jgi:transcriptional regulator with XRE-family HTH domain